MNTPLIRSLLVFLTSAVLLLTPASGQITTRVSVDSTGVEGNNYSYSPSNSADGRYVAFESDASNLVSGDTNGQRDVFVHDRRTGQTSRVSVNSSGVQGNLYSQEPAISADGRYVVFYSSADNLVPNDTNGFGDIFVHDRQSFQTTRVSVNSANVQSDGHSNGAASISADGRYVAFHSFASNLVSSDLNGYDDVFVHDRQLGQTTLVSINSAGLQANHYSSSPSISADGRFVAFVSNADNLVAADTNAALDVFVRDRLTGATTRSSTDSAGAQVLLSSFDGTISSDGRYVAFGSNASDLVQGDTNSWPDVFVKDLLTNQTNRVSVDSIGGEGDQVSQYPSISSDGRYVAFQSSASNLVLGDTNVQADIFLHDSISGQTTRVSVDSAGMQGNSSSVDPVISSDGLSVAFRSNAANLVPGDTNMVTDIIVRDPGSAIFHLTATGTCPGLMTLTISYATANRNVALVYGPSGNFVKSTTPCQGLVLEIAQPRLGAYVAANASGTAVLSFYAPPGVCGLTVQAVDVPTCTATNVIVL